VATVKLRNELWEKVKEAAAARGYSSPEEFVEHLVERELAKTEEAQSEEEVMRRLKGLGYIE